MTGVVTALWDTNKEFFHVLLLHSSLIPFSVHLSSCNRSVFFFFFPFVFLDLQRLPGSPAFSICQASRGDYQPPPLHYSSISLLDRHYFQVLLPIPILLPAHLPGTLQATAAAQTYNVPSLTSVSIVLIHTGDYQHPPPHH